MSGSLLEIRGVCKSFAGIRAVSDVSFTVAHGEVRALMGENGAGKSTLMKILAGLIEPDSGRIVLRGQLVTLRNPHDAMRRGIAMIHQELMPIPDLTVAENILLGHEPASVIPLCISRRSMRRRAQELLDLLGVSICPASLMRELSVAEIQTVEIARALSRNADLVIMDEPSSAISAREVEALFRVIRTLQQRNVAIIYISHKMDEVFEIADSVTVLRDGAHIATCAMGEVDEPRLISLMVGREYRGEDTPAERETPAGAAALEVRGLTRAGAFDDISFEVRVGEILGLAGLMGAGRTEVMSAIFGLERADSGDIFLRGRRVRIASAAHAIRLGIGMVTEDRKEFGLVPAMSVRQNMTLASLGRFCMGPFIRPGREAAAVEERAAALGVKAAHIDQSVSELSGGNQQKVVIARTLLPGPSIVILDEPTRGIDVAAKAEVHAIIRRLANEGRSILLVSSELPELLALSDRILVMRQGKISAELNPKTTSQEEILKHAMPV